MVDHNELRTWHEAIMATATENYERDGWDTFVECIGVKDFVEDYNNKNFVDFASALDFYKRGCKVYDNVRKDIQATAF